ncbi:MAG: Mg-chelatase subunit ChlD [Gammaproteobacteria bacterium]|jgi:Mg-chelatase subunit ChlD
MKTSTRITVMKTKLFAIVIFVATVAGVAAFPSMQQAQAITAVNPASNTHQLEPRIEVVFVFDTTSSMSGLIDAAKEKVWSIASTMSSANQNPNLRMGLVAFRDRGDQYVTRVFDLSDDLDSMYAELMDFRAQGGGDGPESVNQALYEAVTAVDWSNQNQVYKTIFLVGDAPPHMDYPDEAQFPEIIEIARQKNIVINTIQSGQHQHTTSFWQHMAALGDGDYFQVGTDGNAVAIATPYDKKLSELGAEVEATRLYYGDAESKANQKKKNAAGIKLNNEMSFAALARRATFNASKSGKVNLLGSHELVDKFSNGEIELEDIAEEEMPASLQALAPEQRKKEIYQLAEKRKYLLGEIQKLADNRQNYIESELAELDSPTETLDAKIFETVKAQAAEAGLKYESDAIRY